MPVPIAVAYVALILAYAALTMHYPEHLWLWIVCFVGFGSIFSPPGVDLLSRITRHVRTIYLRHCRGYDA
jgi:hypothetical protein